jgi:hypothetical protein
VNYTGPLPTNLNYLEQDAPGPLIHDVAVTATLSKAVVGQGYGINVTVTAEDMGSYPETFNVTVYANTTVLASQNVTLASIASANLTCTWNTTGFAIGNYTISAYARPVPNETNTANNNFTAGTVTVSIPGDIDGDFKVGPPDLVLLANAYGSKPGDAKWNPNADINNDGKVDLLDLAILAYYWQQHYP